ncbi:hypothetical protein FQN60_002357, partial [Etheostoma spectabile]
MDSSGKPSTAQIVVLATSSALTAVFYSIYKSRATTVARLKEAKKVSIDQDLKNILSETPGRCVPYAVIEGVVRSVKETLSSQFVDNCKGVIERLTLKEEKMVWNRTTHLCGERPKGIHETEEMLRLEDSVTGVGELVLDNNLVKLQPPKQGFRFFLTRLDYESLLRKQGNSVRLWKILTVVFGIAACSTLLFILWKRYEHHRKGKKERSMLKEFKEQQRKRMRELNVEESSVSPSSCTVCLSRERSCVFLDCGHVCACAQCYSVLPEPKKCPICRATIDRVARATAVAHTMLSGSSILFSTPLGDDVSKPPDPEPRPPSTWESWESGGSAPVEGLPNEEGLASGFVSVIGSLSTAAAGVRQVAAVAAERGRPLELVHGHANDITQSCVQGKCT